MSHHIYEVLFYLLRSYGTANVMLNCTISREPVIRATKKSKKNDHNDPRRNGGFVEFHQAKSPATPVDPLMK